MFSSDNFVVLLALCILIPLSADTFNSGLKKWRLQHQISAIGTEQGPNNQSPDDLTCTQNSNCDKKSEENTTWDLLSYTDDATFFDCTAEVWLS